MSGFTVIGTIRSRHTDPQHTPVQAALNADDHATVELLPRYRDALDALDGFSRAWLITWLAPTEDPPEPALRQTPYLLGGQPRELGILATRGPRRPTPVGLSLVRLTAIEGTTVHFRGVDVLDGTPVAARLSACQAHWARQAPPGGS